ncbi:hypothetical protein DAKH74_042250 [Maudiozyma humilis]|uniref:Uncharacterized protein n=1 Tax=Maudiozyma humilis TaxID=51915 RepID=A0AAV5S181_MAUHU|nr:hypothetical protein DAKH74_042250 [Kazachstania humilis]
MFRSTTASTHNKHCRSKHAIIMRSRRVVPEYHSPSCSAELYGEALMDQEEGDGDVASGEGAQYGDFAVLNHTNHPGAVYYFIELPPRQGAQGNAQQRPINAGGVNN